MAESDPGAEFGPWNPGIESVLPRGFLPLSTMFRPENVSTGIAEAHELSTFCGIPPHELVTFRAERLVVHELLIRVTADLSVPDGQKYADLGVNFREITATIATDYVAPHMDKIVRSLDGLKHKVGVILEAELTPILTAPAAVGGTGVQRRGWFGIFASARKTKDLPRSIESIEDRAQRHLIAWQGRAESADDQISIAACKALKRLVTSIVRHRGRLIGDRTLLTTLASTLACNEYGSKLVGRLIEPYFHRAVSSEGYRLLAPQDRPIVMNVKGASASGKSTMRPLQRKLAARIGVQWADFALMSPDIWRKLLLDYDSLGAARKYAGTLTGHEVEIIDRKLDAYMARKAEEGRMSHLLIDRFRFDSFVGSSDVEGGTQLLTRFGDIVYMLFMITPPVATVERAWKRGEEFGRYKAVDDLLAHNVEAYTGMPRLFFTWALSPDKRVHYEFLDNSVAEGDLPRTVAFGSNGAGGAMNILDLKCLLDVDRFRKINVDASQPTDVYPGAEIMAPENNTEFLRQCARLIPTINFADRETGLVYARLEKGRLICCDQRAFSQASQDHGVKAAFAALGGDALAFEADCSPLYLVRDRTQTLGAWGNSDEALGSEK